MRNKRPADMTTFRPERTVLYVHGATYPARPPSISSSTACPGWITSRRAATTSICSTCAATASRRGRRRWTSKPEANAPIVRGDTAVKDIGAVVDFILKRRNIPRLNLIGWSWGTTLMATYTTQNAGKVERLVLYAPAWIRTTPSLVQTGPGPLGAYRTVTRDQALAAGITGVPEDKKATLIPAGWFDAWADATFATDPVGAKTNPPVHPRAQRRACRTAPEYLGGRQGLLRSGQDHGADAAGARRMGPRHAALHGADAVSAAGQLARQALRAAAGRHPHHHHGEEPARAVRGGAGVPRRGGAVVGALNLSVVIPGAERSGEPGIA